jgi:hypothetical protein
MYLLKAEVRTFFARKDFSGMASLSAAAAALYDCGSTVNFPLTCSTNLTVFQREAFAEQHEDMGNS